MHYYLSFQIYQLLIQFFSIMIKQKHFFALRPFGRKMIYHLVISVFISNIFATCSRVLVDLSRFFAKRSASIWTLTVLPLVISASYIGYFATYLQVRLENEKKRKRKADLQKTALQLECNRFPICNCSS